jgi:hypothetical protein
MQLLLIMSKNTNRPNRIGEIGIMSAWSRGLDGHLIWSFLLFHGFGLGRLFSGLILLWILFVITSGLREIFGLFIILLFLFFKLLCLFYLFLSGLCGWNMEKLLGILVLRLRWYIWLCISLRLLTGFGCFLMRIKVNMDFYTCFKLFL